MSSRRKPTAAEPTPNGAAAPPVTTTTMPRSTDSQRSPFLPTRLEALLLCIYPSTLFLGSLFSLVSSTTRNAPYSSILQSHPPEFAPSYFARKRNVFNLYFVKIGWFWTTLAMAVLLLTHPSFGPPLRPFVLTPRRVRGVLRWAGVTMWWVAVTQWFFGAPLVDRGFTFTGGQCQLVLGPNSKAREGMSDTREYVTAAACRLAGGSWRGGHDISGHVFLLILGSALLWFEVLPALTKAEGLRDGRRVRMADGQVRSVAAEAMQASAQQAKQEENKTSEEEQVTKLGVKVAVGIVGLMWWMLLMTAAFFHTWFEKFTGLLVAFAALWSVYLLPRGVPGLRAVLGMPGI